LVYGLNLRVVALACHLPIMKVVFSIQAKSYKCGEKRKNIFFGSFEFIFLKARNFIADWFYVQIIFMQLP
jgi:hypothetical protein